MVIKQVCISRKSNRALNEGVTEQDVVRHLLQKSSDEGIQVDAHTITNCYIALKSKPLAILIGPAQSGKTALARSLAEVLTDNDPIRCQMMDGHPWWAARTGDVAVFTQVHERLISAKILALIEEAWQPEQTSRLLIGCLMRLSLAEIGGLFSGLAFQLQHGNIMYLPGAHLAEAVPYPDNLLLLGTLDTEAFDWANLTLLSKATIIQWPSVELKPGICSVQRGLPLALDSVFLSASIRHNAAARDKLYTILKSQPEALLPLDLIERILNNHRVSIQDATVSDMMIYLANAWTDEGIGLFEVDVRDNLAIASDFAITQILLPPLVPNIHRSPVLANQLRRVLNQFSHTTTFLNRLAANH